MLPRLVQLFEGQHDSLSLAEISRAINAQPSAVLDMIDLLVRKGKLVEIGPDGQCCQTCGEQSDCSLLVTIGKRYAAANKLAALPASPKGLLGGGV